MVTIQQGKIKFANKGDKVFGIISGNGSIVGDAHEDEWNGRFERDIFGRLIYEWLDVEHEEVTGVDNDGTEIIEKVIKKEYHMKLNKDYDSTTKYIPRSERTEWDIVGLMGKLIVIDDGTCIVDGYCSSTENGIATNGEDFLVLERLDDTHIKILKI